MPAAVVAPTRAAARSRQVLFALAFAYFACYVPYSAIVKALTSTRPGATRLPGLTLLPLTTLASLLSMVAAISLLGWWRYATPTGRRWPRPTRWTFLSGIATATILMTTTLAYTFEGVSLPFVMLVMRGGVLVLAPIVDALSARKIRWFSWAALALSLISLADAFASRDGAIPLLCVLDLALYLTGYFVRLRLMARLGKSHDPATRRRYFVEEQMVATPAAVALIAVIAALGPASLSEPLRQGYAGLDGGTIALALVAGICSQGTGLFGGLMLLDASETTYCVPLNRAASILGGLAASTLLAAIAGLAPPSGWEVIGAGVLGLAVAVLWLGPAREHRAAGA